MGCQFSTDVQELLREANNGGGPFLRRDEEQSLSHYFEQLVKLIQINGGGGELDHKNLKETPAEEYFMPEEA